MEIPTISLARTGGSPKDAFKEFAREHGSTDPIALERRRIALSGRIKLIEQTIEKLVMAKKSALLRIDKRINEAKKSNANSDAIEELSSARLIEEANYDERITRFSIDAGMLEGVCLTVDALTLRIPCKSKSGKRGFARFNATSYLQDLGVYIGQMLKMHSQVYGLPEFSECVEEGDEEAEAEDGEIVSKEESEALKKETPKELKSNEQA